MVVFTKHLLCFCTWGCAVFSVTLTLCQSCHQTAPYDLSITHRLWSQVQIMKLAVALVKWTLTACRLSVNSVKGTEVLPCSFILASISEGLGLQKIGNKIIWPHMSAILST